MSVVFFIKGPKCFDFEFPVLCCCGCLTLLTQLYCSIVVLATGSNPSVLFRVYRTSS